MRTKTARFKRPTQTAAPDKSYDTEYGKYAGMANAVLSSPRVYSGMRSTIPRFAPDHRKDVEDEYEELLKNPGRMQLKFVVKGNLVLQRTSDHSYVTVGRQSGS